MQEGAHDREDPAGDGVDDVEQQLGGGVGDADVFDQSGQVVADDVVAGELAEPGEGDVEHEAVAAVAGLDHVAQVEDGVPGGHAFGADGFLHFVHFEADEGMVVVAVGVVVGDEGTGFFDAAFGDEPGSED